MTDDQVTRLATRSGPTVRPTMIAGMLPRLPIALHSAVGARAMTALSTLWRHATAKAGARLRGSKKGVCT